MLRPSFEEAVENSQDIVDRGMRVFYIPGSYFFKHQLLESPIPSYQQIGKEFIVPDTWDEYEYYLDMAMETGEYAYSMAYLDGN